MLNLIYVPFIGFPLCCFFVAMGCLLCCTILGIPPGLSLIALGFKSLTLTPRPVIRTY